MADAVTTAADYLESLKARMSGNNPFNPRQFKRKKKPLARQTVVTTRFDERAWHKQRDKNEALDEDITDLYVGTGQRQREDLDSPSLPAQSPEEAEETHGREAYDNAPELVQDLWQTLYKPVPRTRNKKEIVKDARLNQRIIEEVLNHPDYERLHDLTMTDATMTTMATHTFMDTLRQILERNREQVQQSNEDRKENGQPTGPGGYCGLPGGGSGDPGEGEGQGQGSGDGQSDDDADEEGDGGDGQGQGQGDSDGDPSDQQSDDDGGSGGGHDQYDDDEDLTNEGGDGMDDESDGKGEDHDGSGSSDEDDDVDLDDLDRAIHKAMEDAADEFEELDGLRRGIGMEDGQWQQMSPDKRLAMLEKLKTPQMKVLSDIVGRMKKFAMSMQAQKIIDAPEEAFDVEQGNDIRRLLRSEFVYLANDDTKPIFYQKYLERELLQFKLRGRENAGKGPIFVCIDKSYSMSGGPFNWAMAVAEALRRICAEQDRDYFATFFGTNDDRHRFDFPKGETDFDKVMEFLQAPANGGTQFDGVLTEALERTEEYGKQGAEKADIVFITDGQAHLSQEWIDDFNERRHEHSTRVFSVFIGGARDFHGSAPVKLLESFSDVVIPVSDLREDSAADIFKMV